MSNRQVKVTLDESTFAAVDRLAIVTGFSRSSVVASLLRPNAETIRGTAEVLEKAAALQSQLSIDAGKVFRNVFELVEHQAADGHRKAEVDQALASMRQTVAERDTGPLAPFTADPEPLMADCEDCEAESCAGCSYEDEIGGGLYA